MGSRDHRADGADPLAAAAADAQAVALDVPDGPVHAGDQKTARQARLGPAAPAAGDAGVLQGEQDQPARVGPAGAGAAAGLPLAVLHAAHRPAARHLPGHQPSRHAEPQPCGETAASHFLFIPDLTSRATGAVLVALIVLYVGSQLVSFLLSANPTMDKTQRMIFIALPFCFITIAWQLPAGLLVYWITTNTWTIVQGAIVRKRLGHLRQAAQDTQAAAGGRGGVGGLFKPLRGEDRPQPPPSLRRPRTSGDSTTKIPTGSGT